MAPQNPTAAADAHLTRTSEPKKRKATLANLKSTLQSTKAKLRSYSRSKVTKARAKGKAVKKQERWKQTTGRFSVIEETVSLMATSSSSDESQSDTGASSYTASSSPHSSLAARDLEVGATLGRGSLDVSISPASTQEEEKLIRRELEIHQNLAHKNILKLLAWFHDEKSIYLVLEFAAGGSLYSRLKKQPKSRFTEHQTAIYMAQIASALCYMNNKNIMHRDIKPENILLGFHSEIKLADFGYSVHSESGYRSTVRGTLDYLSPEVAVMMLKPGMSSGWYTKAIDQWSLGVLMYELLVGRPPFEMKNTKSTQRKIANFKGKGIKFPGHISQGAEELIRELLNLEAEKRMSLDDVLAHGWIMGHVEKSVQSGLRSFDQLLQ
ncbi:Serine/threonine protein kinase [Pyrenophora tritici-repentis]|nr:Serine/threonine protein kinase [Pyrenophora tritici-repentis]KAI1681556.1 Serine/threonine protein kinase [Pyrenophora tritici-repentis]